MACGIGPDGSAAPAVFSGLAPGPYVVTPAGAADGFVPLAPAQVTLGAGPGLTVTVTAPATAAAELATLDGTIGTILVLALDAATGAPAPGSCFLLEPGSGTERGAGCVVPGEDGAAAPPLTFTVPAPGSYTVTALQLPPGTVPRPASQETAIQPGQTFTLVIGIVAE